MKLAYFALAALVVALVFQQYTLHKTFLLNTELQAGIMRNLDIVEWACGKGKKR
jgi:hypothetical protein